VTGRSVLLFIAAAIAEIGGAYLVWIGLKEDKGAWVVGLGMLTLGIYGVIAALQPDANFGRVLAADGGSSSSVPWLGEWPSTDFAPTGSMWPAQRCA